MPLRFTHPELLASTGKCNANLSFTFLNRTHDFDTAVDWNFSGYGKLWNYNLQYFDFLFDAILAEDIKNKLVNDFAVQLLDNKIKPEPYPVSLRLINWIIYCSQTGFTSVSVDKALKQQVCYLENNLEFHIQANHLLENYLSLSVAAVYLQDDKLSKKAWQGLQQQLQEQVLKDGAHYECSPMYHCTILSRLLLLLDIVKNNKHHFFNIEYLSKVAAKMLGWLQAFSFINGTWAFCNDATDGIVIDNKTIFNVAAAMKIVPEKIILEDSGYRRMSNEYFDVLFDAGDIMPSYQPGHAHSDMLQVIMNVNNQPFLVDRGISTYEANALRLEERSTTAHNTIVVDNKNQSAVWSSFRVGKRAKITWLQATESFCSASHNGYQQMGIVHQRTVTLQPRSVVIEDFLEDNKTGKTAEAHFHFHYTVQPVVSNNIINTNAGASISFKGHEAIELQPYQQALGFNKSVDSYKLVVRFSHQLLTQFEAA